MQSPSTGPIGSVQVLATLESMDRPSPQTSHVFNPSSVRSEGGEQSSPVDLPRRISRLPPLPTIPVSYPGFSAGVAGPSAIQRYFFVAIRRGHTRGVYSSWAEAEKQILVSCRVCDSLRLCEKRPFGRQADNPGVERIATG